ncbi:MAG: hypothetical protein ACERKZ_13905 [Lachnotalea sp.]
MILLKANDKLKTVFLKIIKTMGVNVNWIDLFFIKNNDLILLGKGRSLIFNFDNKRAYSNLLDINVTEDAADEINQNELLENVLNMTLYVFGKWGQIKGLKVEKDYDQLNKLLNYILEDIKIEAVLTNDNLRFYQNGVQITYEDIIQIILDKVKVTEEEKPEQADDAEEQDEEAKQELSLGLWNKMLWKSNKFSFIKEELSEEDKAKSRLGNDFYMVNYKCPVCGDKLYMVVYPIEKEFRIETDESGVYLSRAYTCNTCNEFYTPKPDKLLGEGDVYYLMFEEDKVAYEDYLELMGKQGRRTSNCNFNEYEAEYNKKRQASEIMQEEEENSLPLEELMEEIDFMEEEEIVRLLDKMDAGFYPEENLEKFHQAIEQELRSRKNGKKKIDKDESRSSKKKREKKQKLLSDKAMKNSRKELQKNQNDEKEVDGFEGSKDLITTLLNGDQELFANEVEKLTHKQLGALKILIQSEQGLNENVKKDSINVINKQQSNKIEKELVEKANSCKGKNYAKIITAIEDIKKDESIGNEKNSVLNSLMDLLEQTGKKELAHIISKIPETVSKDQYVIFKNKIEEYKQIDTKLAKKYLDEKRDIVEKQEIGLFIKRANPKDRKSHLALYDKLKEQNFEERNATPFLEKLNEKVYAMDEAAIRKICPEPADITFEDGLQAYDEILLGDFLPDLKSHTLDTIDKRLTKLKMDECEKLVNKISKEISQFMKAESRIYFYRVRKMLRGNSEDTETIIVNNALNTYAKDRGKYEYPILIGDTSYSVNGQSGFVLTPNHIYYSGLLSSGVIDINDIENVYASTKALRQGIYVDKLNSKTVKISSKIKLKEFTMMGKALNDFVDYLKEKPESRNISYLAKEVHQVKCCYRCGYVYKEGSICPRCGSKFNE